MDKMRAELIAPCGINCRLCLGYHRTKNHCTGCKNEPEGQAHHCSKCSIRNCDHLRSAGTGFCDACEKYPCRRLKDLDKRYRTKYHTSIFENLEQIRCAGMEQFLLLQEQRWNCPECGAVLCMHRDQCPNCQYTYTESF